jgi:hypothetical protein
MVLGLGLFGCWFGFLLGAEFVLAGLALDSLLGVVFGLAGILQRVFGRVLGFAVGFRFGVYIP